MSLLVWFREQKGETKTDSKDKQFIVFIDTTHRHERTGEGLAAICCDKEIVLQQDHWATARETIQKLSFDRPFLLISNHVFKRDISYSVVQLYT